MSMLPQEVCQADCSPRPFAAVILRSQEMGGKILTRRFLPCPDSKVPLLLPSQTTFEFLHELHISRIEREISDKELRWQRSYFLSFFWRVAHLAPPLEQSRWQLRFQIMEPRPRHPTRCASSQPVDRSARSWSALL